MNLTAVRFGQSQPASVAPLPANYRETKITNAIIASGTNSLALSPDVRNAAIFGLQSINPDFFGLIKQATQTEIEKNSIDLAQWPNIDSILTVEDLEDIRLSVALHTYWQLDAVTPGQAFSPSKTATYAPIDSRPLTHAQ